jgi:uncharacterized protein YjbJ (UPF0337 family)
MKHEKSSTMSFDECLSTMSFDALRVDFFRLGLVERNNGVIGRVARYRQGSDMAGEMLASAQEPAVTPLTSRGSVELMALLGVTSLQATGVLMDKDRIEGSVEQAKGKVKEVAGKVTGDSKAEAEGKADQVKGKVQNTIGGIKDTLRGN